MRSRIISAVAANVSAQAITALIQVASIPVFLHFWSLERYGQWLILAAMPAYFSLADFGFLSVAINKMTMLAAAGEQRRMEAVFQTAVKLCLAVVIGGVVLACIVAELTPGPLFAQSANKLTLVLLVLSAVLAMSSGIVDAVFRSAGEYALGTYLVNGARLIEWLGLIVGLTVGGGFLDAACGQLLGRLVAITGSWAIARWRHPRLKWGVRQASMQELREMCMPALSFMAFPTANAISLQGMTILVGHLFGPVFLATFSAYRTVGRILVQFVAIIGRSLWPEISRRFGSKDVSGVMNLYRRGLSASIASAAALSVALFVFGPTLLDKWTSGRIPFDKSLFGLFLVAGFLTSAWQMGMVLVAATNMHARLSGFYLAGSFLCVLFTAISASNLGHYSPVAGMIGFELLLVIVCAWQAHGFVNARAEAT